MSSLGIDIGTTGCKAATFTSDGRILASAYREYAPLHPEPDQAELDSHKVWTKISEVIREVSAETLKDPVTALSISSLGEAMVPVSKDREILDNSILCSDARGNEYVEHLRHEISQENFYEINPNILGVNYSLPKLLWIREHNPALYEKADYFLLWADFLAFMLGCEPVACHSLANRTLLFDIRREDWSDKLLAMSGIERDKLGRTVASGEIVGTVTDTVATDLGLPKGVQVVAGGHDQCCNALGAGCVESGSAVCGMGTFECITPCYDHIPSGNLMLPHGLNIEHHVVPDLYVSFLYNQGGCLVKWFRDTFASADSKLLAVNQDIYDRLNAEMPDNPTRLLVLPCFEMTGPPNFIGDASGVIAGLKTSTTRGEILKAIMECETLYFVDCMESLHKIGIDTSEFIATGGGARSDRWLQIKADIFNTHFVRPKITEAGLAGAAILAGSATGAFANVKEGVKHFVEVDRVFYPDRVRHEFYMSKLERYRQLLPLLHDLLRRL